MKEEDEEKNVDEGNEGRKCKWMFVDEEDEYRSRRWVWMKDMGVTKFINELITWVIKFI